MSKCGSKKMGQLLAVLLAVIMVFSVMSPTAYAANGDNKEDIKTGVEKNDEIQRGVPNAQNVAVSVNKQGNGAIKVNGTDISSDISVAAGTVVKLEVIPAASTDAEKYYIKSLKIGNETVTVDKYASYTNESLTVNEDMSVEVVFAKEYTVTASAGEGGTITINGQSNAQVGVDSGNNAEIVVKPAEGFWIDTLEIAGENKQVNDPTEFKDTVTVDKNITVNATFIKVYQITVTYDEATGVVEADSSKCEGGKAIVKKKGESLSIKATPNTNYRVSEVTKNGVATTFNENGYKYSEEITSLDRDYEYVITFALNTFKLTAPALQNGSIAFENEGIVNYNEETTVKITPDDGYMVSGITVDGVSQTLETNALYVENADNTSTYKISVTKDTEVAAEFKEIPKAENALSNYVGITGYVNEPVGGDNKITYYCALNNSLKISLNDTEYNQIRVKVKEGNSQSNYSAWSDSSLSINEECIIEKIEVRKNKGFNAVVVFEGEIEVIVDDKEPELVLSDVDAINGKAKDVYNSDVLVKVSIVDGDKSSGIKSVQYYIGSISDGENMPENATLSEALPGSEQGEYNITIDSKTNNRSDIRLFVKATDYAVNTGEVQKDLDIDITAPEISVSYDDDVVKPANVVDGKYYYSDENGRTAKIVIKERKNHFDSVKATEGIKIIAKDGKDKDEEITGLISNWVTDEGASPDEATHTATITYNVDANYTFDIKYTDKAGNQSGAVNYGSSIAPTEFTIDRTAPTGEIKAVTAEEAAKYGEKAEGHTWDSLEIDKNLLFGIFSNKSITVSMSAEDKTAPYDIEYYKVNYKTGDTLKDAENDSYYVPVMSKKELDDLDDSEWADYDEVINIFAKDNNGDKNEQFVIYARIVDYAENKTYINSSGLIVDNKLPSVDKLAPEITINPQQPVNGIYNSDVDADISVKDQTNNDVYSGLREINYEIQNYDVNGKASTTQTGTLYNTSEGKLKKSWNGEITVDAEKNNSNKVKIIITATDNAGNSITEAKEIKIDTTAPTISLSYDNNDNDSGSYYKKDRTATIVVTERNFDPKDVIVKLSNNEGKVPTVSAWKTETGTLPNGDDTKHIATVKFHNNGNYKVEEISCHDIAGNKCEKAVPAEGTNNPFAFTIDQIKPTISVKYDNNSVKNGKYFSAKRTATITIREHNFDINRVEFKQTSNVDGRTLRNPSASWKHNGDIHTATIRYTADGDYKFNVKVTDKAGNVNGKVNYGNSSAPTDFTIDTYIAEPEITGVKNGSAYKGDISLEIICNDINYSGGEIKLTQTRINKKNVDVTAKFIRGLGKTGKGGSSLNNTFAKKPENDGIYTLYVKQTDKAGNQKDKRITFTINRFGSVYEFNDYLDSLIRDGGTYVKHIEKNLVITEYNASRLVSDSLKIEITRDGKPMENIKFDSAPVISSNVSIGSSGWYQYRYTIGKENFLKDGIYKITVSSKDEAGNNPENTNFEEKTIVFNVDGTAPELISVVGMEEAIVNATKVNVKYNAYDAQGLKSIKVYVNKKNVKDVDDFSADANNYEGAFVVNESSSTQPVRIVLEDRAGNVTDTDSAKFTSEYEFNKEITVSTNIFVRWFANKPLFFGSLAVIILLAASFWFFFWKKRRKNEDEEIKEL